MEYVYITGLLAVNLIWLFLVVLGLPGNWLMVLTAAGLGFLGLGAQPPAPEWGAMIAAGRPYLFDQWWLVAVPGAAIGVSNVVIEFNFISDEGNDQFSGLTIDNVLLQAVTP